MSEQRIATGSAGNAQPIDVIGWQDASVYKSRADLSRLLDDLHATLLRLRNSGDRDETIRTTFQRAADAITAVAMGFNLDYVTDRINAITAELRPDIPTNKSD